MGFYSLLLPPPNLTGALHLGHLWNIILQDFRFKWSEIRKDYTYWAIGVDHAGLSFQTKFDSLYSSKYSGVPREEYFQEMHSYASLLRKQIHTQFSLISPSLPVEQSRYTLEEGVQKLVIEYFLKLFSQGLIYKKKRLVNWDLSLREVLADCDLSYKSINSKLYYIKYPLAEDTDKYIVVATSRPETLFGDVALFVHPEDERYLSYISKKVYIPGTEREIPILSDVSIDREFGTGVMKCTPAHDSLDWTLKEKYSLNSIEVFDDTGKLLEIAQQFQGQDRLDARPNIVDWLKSINLIEKIEDYQTKVAFSEKSNTPVEKILTEQWFLSSSKLAKNLLSVLKENKFKFRIFPEEQAERLFYYLENMEDWCLSRQIPWGIRIPIVFDKKFKKYRINQEVKNTETEIDESIVLDTWFSSSLWPFLVFEGKPKEKAQFLPFTTLISGKDILLPWISRMLFLSYHLNSKLPFKSVFLHGLLRNNKGEKMSKSLGNGILPEDLYSKYSSDVIRFSFLLGTNYDRDLKYSESIFQKAASFLHKLENIFKFVYQKINIQNNRNLLIDPIVLNFNQLSWAERWILREFSLLGEKLENWNAEYDYFSSSREIVRFFSEILSNNFLELIKLEKDFRENSIKLLGYIWKLSSRILYPFVPEFSKKSYKELFSSELKAVYPNQFYPEKIESNPMRYEWFFEYTNEIRKLYKALGLDYSQEVKLRIIFPERFSLTKRELSELEPFLKRMNHSLLECSTLRNESHFPVIKIKRLYFELFFDSLPLEKYKLFLKERIEKYSFEIERSKKILSRDSFKENAPPELIKKESSKYREYSSLYKFHLHLSTQLN